MTDINRVILVGRLTRDAETKHTASGAAVTRFSIAVNRRVKRGDEWEDEASFFDLVLWGHEGLIQYLVKGKQVAVDGELNQNRWEQDGQKRSKVEVIVGSIELLGNSQVQNADSGAARGAPKESGFNDDAPF
jgi:single-strand DNA-binding protein